MKNKDIFLVVHNVRSILNVGSMFRTADAAGVSKIYLSGYTPTPNSHADKIAKTALGAEKFVSWEHHAQTWRLLAHLKKEGVCVVALEQSPRSKNIFKFKAKFPLALVVGNEVRGLSTKILKQCDNVLEIPMHGKKESLNVAVAAGIALYALKTA